MLSKLQWRCLMTFCVPFLFLLIFFALNYSVTFFHLIVIDSEVVVLSALAMTGMEILWGYFPEMGGYIFLTSKKRREEDRKVASENNLWLVPREKRFFFLVLPALISLGLITIGKIFMRFNCPDCFLFWVCGVLLEINWLYLQGTNIYCWVKDCWESETKLAKKNGTILSRKQERCMLGFVFPFALLSFLIVLFRTLEANGGSQDRLVFISLLIDLLFVFGTSMGIYSWIADNWRREMREGDRF